MSFQSQVIADSNVMLADFGESIVIRPPSGANRTVTAIVERQPPDDQIDARAIAPRIRITLKNSTTAGIASSEAVTDFSIDVAARYGGTALTRKVLDILGPHDLAMLTVEVR